MPGVNSVSRMCCLVCGLSLTLLLADTGCAAPPPISRDEQAGIDKAIKGGVIYLKRTQKPLGTWAARKEHMLGYAALPGLALLESGLPATDPVVRRAASFVRSMAPRSQETYELALSILFLDRLGNPRDKELIQALALRLVAGQGTTGGWTYRCPILPKNYHRDLLILLRRLDPPDDGKEREPLEAETARKPGAPLHEETVKPRQGLKTAPAQPRENPPLEKGITTRPSSEKPGGTASPLQEPKRLEPSVDNKPAADRKPAPAAPQQAPAPRPQEAADRLVVIPAHLRAMPIFHDLVPQRKQPPRTAARRAESDNSNTQFALLGLWVAQRHGVPMKRTLQLLVQRFQGGQNEDGSWGYRSAENRGSKGEPAMTCVGLMGLAVGHGLASNNPDREGPPPLDPRIPHGFTALRQYLEPGGEAPHLYFLWSLERVSVLYQLPAIGDKDWYRYGVALLLPAQQHDGSWNGGGYPGATPTIDTCLALLFLKRVNFIEDLSKKLRLDREALTKFITDKQPASKSSSSSSDSPGGR